MIVVEHELDCMENKNRIELNSVASSDQHCEVVLLMVEAHVSDRCILAALALIDGGVVCTERASLMSVSQREMVGDESEMERRRIDGNL